jgi:hypothetical protein
MKLFKICLFISFTIVTQTSFAQWETDPTRTETTVRKRPDNRVPPVSFKHSEIFTTNFLKSLPSVNLPALNNDSIIKCVEAREKEKIGKHKSKTGNVDVCGVYYSGSGIHDTIDLKSKAQYYNPDIDNGKLWILKISSSTAVRLGFYFSKFDLPEGSSLYIYATDRTKFTGPFTSANNPKDKSLPIQFGVPEITGNVVYLEYFESKMATFEGSIIIANIIHGFR